MRCIITDDDLSLLCMTKHYLAQHLPEHWTIMGASNAFHARRVLHHLGGTEILATDRHMPGENGLSLIHFVAEIWPATRFILMSSDREKLHHQDKSKAYKYFQDQSQGIHGLFLEKPFPLKRLLKAIQYLIISP